MSFMITTLDPPIPTPAHAKALATAPTAISIKLNNDLMNHFKECLRTETTPKLVVKDGIYVSIERREERRRREKTRREDVTTSQSRNMNIWIQIQYDSYDDGEEKRENWNRAIWNLMILDF